MFGMTTKHNTRTLCGYIQPTTLS